MSERPKVEELLRAAAGESSPAHLEDRIVQAMTKEGLVEPKHESAAPRRAIWAIAASAAAVAIFAGGWQVGRMAEPAPGVARTQPSVGQPVAARPPAATHALLLYEDASYQAPADEAAGKARVAEYTQWAVDHHAEVVGGEELLDAVASLGAAPAEPRRLGGFFLIRVKDAEAARRLAGTNPHLKYGGGVVVRAIGATAPS